MVSYGVHSVKVRYCVRPRMLICLFGTILWGFQAIWKRGLNRNMDDVAYMHDDVCV